MLERAGGFASFGGAIRALGIREERITDSFRKSLLCVKAAAAKKASDLLLLEMKRIASFTDYFLLCSGKSDRQVQAIAQAIEEELERKAIRPLGLEGKTEGRWILMDYGDVVVHIFLEPIRAFYDLEGLWIDAPRVELEKGEQIGQESLGSEEGT